MHIVNIDFDIKEVTPNQTIVDMLVEMKAVSSKREAKEFVTNGAISVNGEKITFLAIFRAEAHKI